LSDRGKPRNQRQRHWTTANAIGAREDEGPFHRGSPGYFDDDFDRPKWTEATEPYHTADYYKEDGSYTYTIQRGREPNDPPSVKRVRTIRWLRMSCSDAALNPQDAEAWERGGYYKGLGDESKGEERRRPVLYRLVQLIEATKDRGPEGKRIPDVDICEGEPDADVAARLDLTATSAPFGALYWNSEWNDLFKGCDVALPIDNDENGRRRAWKLAKELEGIAHNIRVVEFGQHKDLKAWAKAEQEAGKSEEAPNKKNRRLSVSAKMWIDNEKRAGRDYSDFSKSKNAAPDQKEIDRLAALSFIDYERERAEAAAKLGIRVSAEVERARRRHAPEDDGNLQGQALNLSDVDPWPEAVVGDELLKAIVAQIRLHVILTEEQAIAVALWIVHAHALDYADHSPRLHVTSPLKRCGKTVLLSCINPMVPRPLGAENISAAALFRVIEMAQPTLLVDEADAFMTDNEEL
jgi:hypothetical protein